MQLYNYPDPKYKDREHAGRVLASRLIEYQDKDLVVLAIPNGGIPVGNIIAEKLGAEMYLMIVRKLQVPDNPEAGFGALTSEGFLLLNEPLIKRLGLMEEDILLQKEKALESIWSRQQFFGKRAKMPPLGDRTVVLVDDGLASGFTMGAAVESARNQGAKRIIIAVPTSSMTAFRRLESKVEKIICPDLSRTRIFAVANAYQDWYDLDQEEALSILSGREKHQP